MKRFGFSIEVVNDAALEMYKEMHKQVPQEISGDEGALKKIGLQRMSIYLLPNNTLFMQVEANDDFDPLRDFTYALSLHPIVKEWDDKMHGKDNPLLRRSTNNNTELNWLRLEQVYDWSITEMANDS
ncbi:L-rhamnose mutarotase [Xenorhabdus sp. BG5]|uniref:L-rhamnose mutarotase n=1 Tax=Xenorhabdus sp. BG5 TaxID=2782014 RepID=UPI0018827A6D|nr:L-rhamnose mutarotase [Xenorhabdus sp. BG5]MBE8597077.1 L-rhamnose mutarotase [Xenorhabdus sp. BG5]